MNKMAKESEVALAADRRVFEPSKQISGESGI